MKYKKEVEKSKGKKMKEKLKNEIKKESNKIGLNLRPLSIEIVFQKV